MNYYQNKMKTKNVLILTTLAIGLFVGCKKSPKPNMKHTQASVEIEALSSNVPLGDDDDERILIKPKLFLPSGHVAIGAEVHTFAVSFDGVESGSFSTSGVVSPANDLALEVPEVGYYRCDVIYGGSIVLANQFFVSSEGLSLSGVIPVNQEGYFYSQ